MRKSVLTVLTVCLLSGSGQAGSIREGTMEEFRPAVVVIAKGVAKVLKSRKEESITVGVFTGPEGLGTAAGAGLKQLVIEELNRLDVQVSKMGTSLGLTGKYLLAQASPEVEFKQVQLEVQLTDDSGQPLTDLASTIKVPKDSNAIQKDEQTGKIKIDTNSTPAATAVAMGLTVDFEQHANLNIDLLNETQRNPTAQIRNGTELYASSKSPFGLQVVVDGEPKTMTVVQGQPYVELEEGDIFHLRLVSKASYGISAVFTLDGVNSFAFSEIREFGRPKYSQWLFQPKEVLELKGWHINNSRVREFKVTDFSKSGAAKIGSESSLGAINVVIRSTWFKGQTPPPGDRQYSYTVGAAPGIGLGDEVEQEVKEDTKVREYGKTRAVLTIRYTRPEE